jgi:hypothetical protein
MEDLEDVEINFIKTEMLPDEELKKYRQCKNDATFQLIYNACGAHLYNFGNHEIRDEEAILKEFNQNIITSDDIVQRTNDYVKTMAPNNTKFEYCASCGILLIQQPEFENNSENGKSYIAEPIKVQDLDILICGPPQNIYESIFFHKQNNQWYYLHKDLIFQQNNEYHVLLCKTCNNSIKNNKYPRYSLSQGYDYGPKCLRNFDPNYNYPKHEIIPLSEAEKLVIARGRI